MNKVTVSSQNTQTSAINTNSLIEIPIKQSLICEGCKRVFDCARKINEHKKNWENKKQFECHKCCQSFAKPHTLKQHLFTCTGQGRPNPDFKLRPSNKKTPNQKADSDNMNDQSHPNKRPNSKGEVQSSGKEKTSSGVARKRMSQGSSSQTGSGKQLFRNPVTATIDPSRTTQMYAANSPKNVSAISKNPTTSIFDRGDEDNTAPGDDDMYNLDSIRKGNKPTSHILPSDLSSISVIRKRKVSETSSQNEANDLNQESKKRQLHIVTTNITGRFIPTNEVFVVQDSGENNPEEDPFSDKEDLDEEGNVDDKEKQSDDISAKLSKDNNNAAESLNNDSNKEEEQDLLLSGLLNPPWMKEQQHQKELSKINDQEQQQSLENFESQKSMTNDSNETFSEDDDDGLQVSSINEAKSQFSLKLEAGLETSEMEMLLSIWEIRIKMRGSFQKVALSKELWNSLGGITPVSTAIEDLVDFLSKKYEDVVGLGVMGVLVMNYARLTSFDSLTQLLQLAKEKAQNEKISSNLNNNNNKKEEAVWTNYYAPLIQLCVLYYAQKKVLQQNDLDDILCNLSQSDISQIDFITEDGGKNLFLNLVCDLINDSCKGQEMVEGGLFDRNEKSWEDRCNAWLDICNLVKCLIEQESSETLLQLLLKRARPRRLGTLTFLYLQYDSHTARLDLHPGILAKVKTNGGNGFVPTISTVKVERMDTEKFLHLLYGTNNIVPRDITFGMYQIADELRIDNVWEFLFGKNLDIISYNDYGCNKATVFQILLRVGRKEDLDLVAKNFHVWMPIEDYEACMQFLSPDHVNSFFSRDEIFLEELTIYKLLVNWACHVTGKKCCPFDHLKPDTEIKNAFMSVQNCLRLKRLYKKRNKVIPHCFISSKDWSILSNAMTSGEGLNLEGRFNLQDRFLMH